MPWQFASLTPETFRCLCEGYAVRVYCRRRRHAEEVKDLVALAASVTATLANFIAAPYSDQSFRGLDPRELYDAWTGEAAPAPREKRRPRTVEDVLEDLRRRGIDPKDDTWQPRTQLEMQAYFKAKGLPY